MFLLLHFAKLFQKSRKRNPAAYSSNPKESARLWNFPYDSKYCLPFGVITKVFFPSYSILFIRPAPVRFSINFESLECDKLALVRRAVTLIPFTPHSSVTVSKSLTICMLVLYMTIFGNSRDW